MSGEKEIKQEPLFSKYQFMTSPKYGSHRFVLDTILDDDTEYTESEVQRLLSRFLKKKL